MLSHNCCLIMSVVFKLPKVNKTFDFIFCIFFSVIDLLFVLTNSNKHTNYLWVLWRNVQTVRVWHEV
jgi:hypothetical protein